MKVKEMNSVKESFLNFVYLKCSYL